MSSLLSIKCDICGEPVDFDPALARITRDVGGVIVCEACNPSFHPGAHNVRVDSDGRLEILPDPKDPPKA